MVSDLAQPARDAAEEIANVVVPEIWHCTAPGCKNVGISCGGCAARKREKLTDQFSAVIQRHIRKYEIALKIASECAAGLDAINGGSNCPYEELSCGKFGDCDKNDSSECFLKFWLQLAEKEAAP